MKKIKISELPESKSTDGLYTIGVNASQQNVKVAIGSVLNDKAEKATTLSGYGITDAYNKSETDNSLKAKQDKLVSGTNIKTVNGQSLLGGGNVQLTGADFLLEQGAGVTIREAVNSNTDDINSAISFARRQGVPQAKCFQFSKNYTFYSGSQLKDKTLIVGLYGAGVLLNGSIYYNNSVHELQIGNSERIRLTGRINTSEHAETLVVYFDDVGIAHAYMDGKLCYDFPSNTQPDTVTINVLESRKFKQILLLDGDLHQAANELLWAKGWQDWLINNRNMNTTREVKKIDNSTSIWMVLGTTSYKLYVVDYNITNNTEKEVKVLVNTNTIGYGGDIVVPAGQSVLVRRLIDTSGQGALGYNYAALPFSLTAKSVAVIKGIDYLSLIHI